MNEVNPTKHTTRQRSMWLGMLAAIIVLVGTSVLLENAIVIAGRIWATYIDSQDVWTDHIYGTGARGWVALLIIRFFSFAFAGFVGARIAPARARSTLVFLVVGSFFVTVFEQFPLSLAHSVWSLALWSLCAPVFTGIGVIIAWWHEHQT